MMIFPEPYNRQETITDCWSSVTSGCVNGSFCMLNHCSAASGDFVDAPVHASERSAVFWAACFFNANEWEKLLKELPVSLWMISPMPFASCDFITAAVPALNSDNA